MGALDIDFRIPENDVEPNLATDIDRSDMKSQEIERFRQNTAQRKTLVRWMMFVVSLWLAFTAVIVGIELHLSGGLSNSVMCALLTTTTANVIGLAMIVLRGLFTQKNNA